MRSVSLGGAGPVSLSPCNTRGVLTAVWCGYEHTHSGHCWHLQLSAHVQYASCGYACLYVLMPLFSTIIRQSLHSRHDAVTWGLFWSHGRSTHVHSSERSALVQPLLQSQTYYSCVWGSFCTTYTAVALSIGRRTYTGSSTVHLHMGAMETTTEAKAIPESCSHLGLDALTEFETSVVCPDNEVDEDVPLLDSHPRSPAQSHSKRRSDEHNLIDDQQRLHQSATSSTASENVGILCMAISAFCAALMAMFVELAGHSGLSTWEIIFWRSCVVAVASLANLAWTRTVPWGQR